MRRVSRGARGAGRGHGGGTCGCQWRAARRGSVVEGTPAWVRTALGAGTGVHCGRQRDSVLFVALLDAVTAEAKRRDILPG